MIDFSPIKNKKQTYAEFSARFSEDDLRTETIAMIEHLRSLIAGVEDADVTFVPTDPDAHDPGAGADEDLAWTLGHVIVHITASAEEAAAVALSLARGVEVRERSRYETPWEEMQTRDQVMRRLEESGRMRLAMLDAWPDQPHLENRYTPIPRYGPLNAVARFLLGLAHDTDHLGQLSEILRQARAARNA